MTVQELIDKLQEVKDKSQVVYDYEGTEIDEVVQGDDGIELQ